MSSSVICQWARGCCFTQRCWSSQYFFIFVFKGWELCSDWKFKHNSHYKDLKYLQNKHRSRRATTRLFLSRLACSSIMPLRLASLSWSLLSTTSILFFCFKLNSLIWKWGCKKRKKKSHLLDTNDSWKSGCLSTHFQPQEYKVIVMSSWLSQSYKPRCVNGEKEMIFQCLADCRGKLFGI